MKLRLTLQVKTSPSGRTINVEIIDFIPPEYLLSRATRLASTALQCSQVASGKDPSGVIAVSLGCFQPCFPQRIPTIQSAGIIYYNYNYNYIYIHILPFCFLTCDANSLKTLTQPGFMRKSSYRCRGFPLDPIPPPTARVESTVAAWLAAAPRGYHRLR